MSMASVELREQTSSEADSNVSEKPGVEDLPDLDGRGWQILKFIGFQWEFSNDAKSLKGRFVVSEQSCQPFGVLHGGTTAYIAESIASVAGYRASKQHVAGVELNVNHLRPVPVGREVLVTANPFLVGKRLQVWEVKFETLRPQDSETGPTANSSDLVLAAVARVTLIVEPSKTSSDSLPTKI